METTHPDFFGGETRVAKPHRTTFKDILRRWNYRKAEEKEKCGNCAEHIIHGARKRYHKCALLGDTRSEATDMRVSWVCNHYHRKEGCGDEEHRRPDSV